MMIYRNTKTGIDIITSSPISGENYVLVTGAKPTEEKPPVVRSAEKVSEGPKKEVKKSKKGTKK